MENYKNTMLTSPDSIKAEGQLNYNVSDDVIGASIRTAQKNYLREIIGDALLDTLQKLVYNAIIGEEPNIDSDENEAYKTLLEEYVEPYLISKTIVEVCVPISLKIRNIGIAQDSDINILASQVESIKEVRSYYETHNCEDATRLSHFLCQHKEDYPELSENNNCHCHKGTAPKIGKTFANTGLWLGGDKHKNCCGR